MSEKNRETKGQDDPGATPQGHHGRELSELPKSNISMDQDLPAFLEREGISLAFSTYQAGMLFMVGHAKNEEGQYAVSFQGSKFQQCMGIAYSEHSFYCSSHYEIHRLENALQEGQLWQGHDRLFIPQLTYTTGNLATHEMALNKQGELIFVNTAYSCIAKVSPAFSFTVLWKPSFISALAAEDRCHLNGMAMKDGEPAFVSAVAPTDSKGAWREHKRDGGVIVSVPDNEIVAQGLSMPHSPRFYRDRLWVLNSGRGFFGYIDLDSGEFTEVAFLPGYLRGLAFHKNFAFIGLSNVRQNRSFKGLEIDENLKQKNLQAKCGVVVVDIDTGETVHSIDIEGHIIELFDVVVMPGMKRPMSMDSSKDEVRRIITVEV